MLFCPETCDPSTPLPKKNIIRGYTVETPRFMKQQAFNYSESR
jgi:hypothetical protein